MVNVDDLDRKIIDQLQRDGAATNAYVAEQVGTSEATVRRRRTRLQEEDVIRDITSINPFMLGYKVIVMMGVRVKAGRLKLVEEALCKRPEVRFMGVTFGRYDLVLEAWFKSSEELLEFIQEPTESAEGVENTETFQVIRLSKYAYDWRPPKASEIDLVPDTEELTS